MGLYNMLHGMNPMADQLLACLGLTRSDVGRFRDISVSEGSIAVYTRNGGGNRECWCYHDQRNGYDNCKGSDWEQEEDERLWATKEDFEANPEWKKLNVFMGDKQVAETGKRVIITHHTCDNPGSIDCACPGCIIEYRLPQHPNYKYDEDDQFDSTYATIYFSFPERYKEWLELCEAGKWEPDKKWLDFFRRLEGDNISETEKAGVKSIGDAIEGFLTEK